MKRQDKGKVIAIISTLILVLCPLMKPEFIRYFASAAALILILWYSYGPKEPEDTGNQAWKSPAYLISGLLSLGAVMTIVFTWSPLVLTIYNNSIPSHSNGADVPMRVVGVNYPTMSFVWLGTSFFIFLLILFFLAKRRRPSSSLFWTNGISVSIILSHIIMWAFMIYPFWTGA